MTEQPFHENVVVLTGASSGIGRELAYQLADQGAWLALGARDVARLEAVAAECRNRGGRALMVPTDVTRQADCQNLVACAVREYGRVDTLINNAGITMWAYFETLQDLTPIEQIIQTNFFGSLYCTRAALPHLKETRGRIVVVNSLTGKAGVPTRSGYAASKHALVGFFDSLRIELAPTGVTVTIVYPDFVATETRQRALGADGRPIGASPVQEDKVMTAEACARRIMRAAARRQREDIMSLRGRLGQWLRLIAPAWIDQIALRAVRRGR